MTLYNPPWSSRGLYLTQLSVGGLQPPTLTPAASFTSTTSTVTASFTDTSTNLPVSWRWDFGDGTTSTSQSPLHVYALSGTYPVSLTASNGGGASIATANVTVSNNFFQKIGLAVPALNLPVVAVDFSTATTGSFVNHGTDGGTFDAAGASTYSVAFPLPITGACVLFAHSASDQMFANNVVVGDTTGSDLAVFVVYASTANPPGIANIVDKRSAGFGTGWEIRSSTNGTLSMVSRDAGANTKTVTPAGFVMTGTFYAGMRIDVTNLNQYGWHVSSSSESSVALAAGATFSANSPVVVGKDQRESFGSNTGKVRFLAVWRGSQALSGTKANMDTLYNFLKP